MTKIDIQMICVTSGPTCKWRPFLCEQSHLQLQTLTTLWLLREDRSLLPELLPSTTASPVSPNAKVLSEKQDACAPIPALFSLPCICQHLPSCPTGFSTQQETRHSPCGSCLPSLCHIYSVTMRFSCASGQHRGQSMGLKLWGQMKLRGMGMLEG